MYHLHLLIYYNYTLESIITYYIQLIIYKYIVLPAKL